MKIPKKIIAGIAGIGLIAYAAIAGFNTRNDYHTIVVCDYPGIIRESSANCNYSVVKESEREGFFGLGDYTSIEIYNDLDLDELPDTLSKEGNENFFRFGYDAQFRPQFTKDGKGNSIVVYPSPLPRGSRIPDDVGYIDVIWTTKEEIEINRRFQDILSHLPESNHYLLALSDRQ